MPNETQKFGIDYSLLDLFQFPPETYEEGDDRFARVRVIPVEKLTQEQHTFLLDAGIYLNESEPERRGIDDSFRGGLDYKSFQSLRPYVIPQAVLDRQLTDDERESLTKGRFIERLRLDGDRRWPLYEEEWTTPNVRLLASEIVSPELLRLKVNFYFLDESEDEQEMEIVAPVGTETDWLRKRAEQVLRNERAWIRTKVQEILYRDYSEKSVSLVEELFGKVKSIVFTPKSIPGPWVP